MIGFALVMRHPRTCTRLTEFMPARDLRRAIQRLRQNGVSHRKHGTSRSRLFVVEASLAPHHAKTRAYCRAEEWLAGRPMRGATHGSMLPQTWPHRQLPAPRRLL